MDNELNKDNEKNKVGRPSKMQMWVKQLVNVLDDENIVFLSDSELVFLVNRQLPDDWKIHKSTFEKWKAGDFSNDDEVGKEFIGCIELALIRQKQMLGERMMNETTGQWTRFAWILERKFQEWNLKHISENINRNEQATVIQITAGNEEQKKLIDNIINGEFTEIKPIQLPNKKDVEQTDNEDENDVGF